ncbi:MAG: hypothetical protein KC636_27230, partial [Myxococcales bacterium]|nr:hypothetical protein [Myxococcales bacterium]
MAAETVHMRANMPEIAAADVCRGSVRASMHGGVYLHPTASRGLEPMQGSLSVVVRRSRRPQATGQRQAGARDRGCRSS